VGCWSQGVLEDIGDMVSTRGGINRAFVLDIDLQFGDGAVNIFRKRGYVTIFNVSSNNRESYLKEIAQELKEQQSDVIYNVLALLKGMEGG